MRVRRGWGLVMHEKDVAKLKAIAERERAPMYVIGETTGEHNFTLKNHETGESAIDLQLKDMFGSTPKTYMHDQTCDYNFEKVKYERRKIRRVSVSDSAIGRRSLQRLAHEQGRPLGNRAYCRPAMHRRVAAAIKQFGSYCNRLQ